jgi:lysophospholipase L1-like esterase
MKNSTRRNFIGKMALTGMATFCLPEFLPLSTATANNRKRKLANGSVILFQGDSITDGNRGRNADPNHIMGHGYAFSIASRLGADFPEKRLIFHNRGISGNKINDLAKRWQTDTLDLKPDLLSILVGVNDSASVVFQREPVISVDRFEKEYKSILDLTLQKFPDILFILCEPFILKVGKVKDNWEAYRADMAQRQAIVRNLALHYNAVFVASQEVFDKACEKAPAEYWMWDGVHPTVPGHELLAREWIKQVEKRIRIHT